MVLDSPVCRCGHALAVHDPCSKCECPAFAIGPARKYRKRKVAS